MNISLRQHVPPGMGTPYVGRYVMLGYTWVVFEKKLYFFREMGTFFQQISVFFLQGGYLFWRKFLYLPSKIESICNKFSVFYFTKLVEFTLKISVYFFKMGIFSGDFTVVIGTNLKDPAN